MTRLIVNSVIVVILGMILTGTVNASPLDDDLVAYWNFNGNGNDLSGNNHQGTLHGDAAYIDTQFGKSLYLDGDGDYFTTPYATDLYFNRSFTMSLWINPNRVTGTNQSLINSWSGDISKASFSLQMHNDRVYHTISNPPGYTTAVTKSVLKVNQWQHVTWRFGDNRVSVFIDGEYVDGHDTEDAPLNSNDYSVAIGSMSPNPAGGTFYDGFIDEVKLYGIALTDEQIKENYQNINNPVPEPSTLFLFGMGLIGFAHILRKGHRKTV